MKDVKCGSQQESIDPGYAGLLQKLSDKETLDNIYLQFIAASNAYGSTILKLNIEQGQDCYKHLQHLYQTGIHLRKTAVYIGVERLSDDVVEHYATKHLVETRKMLKKDLKSSLCNTNEKNYFLLEGKFSTCVYNVDKMVQDFALYSPTVQLKFNAVKDFMHQKASMKHSGWVLNCYSQLNHHTNNFIWTAHQLLIEMAPSMFWFWDAALDPHGTTVSEYAVKQGDQYITKKQIKDQSGLGQWTLVSVLPWSINKFFACS
ncbi:hypothetical protein CPB84DRAFT_1749753 [Gymnopilus junonius]|uniref:Uncharacterized protein n=1 Tax=Gymnopilus junonius TaxID=109634 RepID=A0A9P5TJ89_GYMJU|nr:hypothetical protein CPB84DRAFT_1749753 [Gymnopilus junonius]